MKTYRLRIAAIAFFAMLASLSVSAQSTVSEIIEFFQQGETVNISDSIKGKMITFSVEGTLNALGIENPTLPKECRVVLQENKVAWFENLFPARSKNDYHHWLRGALVNDAKVYNPETKEYDDRVALVIFPFMNIDYMEWESDEEKYQCYLNIRNVWGEGTLPQISFDDEYHSVQWEYYYIIFLLENNNTLICQKPFGEIRRDYTTIYNYNVSDPYGIDLDKLKYTVVQGLNGVEAYISGLKLTSKIHK